MCQDIWFANHHTAFQRRLTVNTTSPWDPRLKHRVALIWSWLARRLRKCTKKGMRQQAPGFATHSGCCRRIVLVVQPASYANPSVIFKIILLKNERLYCIELCPSRSRRTERLHNHVQRHPEFSYVLSLQLARVGHRPQNTPGQYSVKKNCSYLTKILALSSSNYNFRLR